MALSKVNRSLVALRHTAVVLLGSALDQLFPTLQLLGGRATSTGFAYEVAGDIDIDERALPLLEERMRGLISKGLPLESREMLRRNAQEYFRHHRQHGKAEMLDLCHDTLVSLQQMGDYLDLAPLPHSKELKEVKAFALAGIEASSRVLPSGERIRVLTISGVVQPDQKALKNYVKRLRAHQEGDHRTLGPAMHLFALPDAASCLWRTQGAELRNVILSWWRAQINALGARMVMTTGASLEPTAAGRHAELYGLENHSQSQLPVVFAECSLVRPVGIEGEQAGLYSLPICTAPEVHLFCLENQVQQMVGRGLDMLCRTVQAFALESRIYLVRGRSGPGRKRALLWLTHALDERKIEYAIDEDGDDATEGPRIDFRIVDGLQREWLASSIAVLADVADSYRLCYQDASGKKVPCVMLSVQLLGSLERWIGLVLEKTEGNLPLWLAPQQIRVLPVDPAQIPYAGEVQKALQQAGWRVGLGSVEESLGARVYSAESDRVPWIAIVGKEEESKATVKARRRAERGQGLTLTLNDFLASLRQEC